jgi:ATP-dependent helicase HrpB
VPPRDPLPVDAVLPECVATLRRGDNLVVRAPTGSGKTTRLPPAILDLIDGTRPGGPASQIVLVEPRRMAARGAARRIAFELGVPLGGEVGYEVRFDRKATDSTRLVVMTDGVLLRKLRDDPFLENVAVVLFDEFHERGLNADLALAMCLRVRNTVRPDLRLVAMSATLDTGRVAGCLGSDERLATIIEAEGRAFPVTTVYLSPVELAEYFENSASFPKFPQAIARAAATGARRMLDETAGDVLVFLPGVGEIRRTAELLEGWARAAGGEVLALYGDLPPEEQDAVLVAGARRRVILATNVAEASVTVPGVTAVVDTGLARVNHHDAGTGLDRLELAKISRASADQRAGRAGRVRPGTCLRLWTERDHASLPAETLPEVRRVDLSGPVLSLLAWGEADPSAFPWIEPPDEVSLQAALALLERLGAMRSGAITPLGQQLARLPLAPRLGRLVEAGTSLGQPRLACVAAALLSERDPFERGGGRPRPAGHLSQSDLFDRVEAFEEGSRGGTWNRAAAETIKQVARQLEQEVARLSIARDRGGVSAAEALGRAVLAAFPDRLAKRREAGSPRAVLVGGRGVKLSPASAVGESNLFVALDIAGDGADAEVRMASAVARDWLPRERLSTREEPRFDGTRERVAVTRATRWEDLVLESVETGATDSPEVAECLFAAARADRSRVLPGDEEFTRFLARVRSLREWMPELELPFFDDAGIDEVLESLCHGRRSFAELRAAPWLDYLRGGLTPEQARALDREAPERIEVPSGSRVVLEYEPGRAPVLAVRIQEVFGLLDTPRVAGGRVPVLLHLLGPNMRPQQVTSDLRSFWTTAYAEVRKELKRRYPKHSWPEDPWTARAERRPGRPH